MNKKWEYWFGIMLSLLIALMPFLGFPRGMKDVFYVLIGIMLTAIFFMLSSDKVNSERK